MPIQDLKAQIQRLPEQPGVYLFANADGETIYVGKARSLRDRVRSYLAADGSNPKTDALVADAHALDFILTDSVVEALALENHLIKQRQPRYNILLRDDKNYPYLQLSTTEAFPRVLLVRRVERDGNYYAGPFLPATLARRTISLTHKLFGIRSCNEEITGRRGRPCLEYDIKRCIAPCVASLCSEEQYARAVAHTRLFLEGRTDELLDQLRARMTEAAAGERFEEAAQARDALRTVQALHDRQQKMAGPGMGDRDAFGVRLGPSGAVIHVFQVRGGRVIERLELVSDRPGGERPGPSAARAPRGPGSAADEAEVLQAAIQQFYEAHEVPPELHVPIELEDAALLEDWLGRRAGRRVRLVVPRRGEKRGLLDLAARNAAAGYDARFDQAAGSYEALEHLRVLLGLASLPRRIECFDVSTIQGSETVASMVVAEEGRMRRAEYRKFRIRGQAGEGVGPPAGARQDDFAAMHEVVLRRYRSLLEHGGMFPDLILVDGGKGQLSSAYQALEALGLERLVAIGLAKKEELIVTRDRPDPVALAPNDPARLLLQRVRDEAHRFAVTFHRKARRQRDLRSEIDAIPGIGPTRRRRLLTTFGSVSGVRRATREELTAAVGARAADAVVQYFADRPGS
jgi:excinuclease ABC subunit C